jgi:hypothetical protein
MRVNQAEQKIKRADTHNINFEWKHSPANPIASFGCAALHGAVHRYRFGLAQVAGEGKPCWPLLTLIAPTRVLKRVARALARVFFKHARESARRWNPKAESQTPFRNENVAPSTVWRGRIIERSQQVGRI